MWCGDEPRREGTSDPTCSAFMDSSVRVPGDGGDIMVMPHRPENISITGSVGDDVTLD
uniref:Uncharacterized protein n=1 Tax=Arundo donax TaxID=35708 RepID=A0A0A8ZZH9_ARUDO